jgi:DNA gyrase subunit A
MKGITMMPRDKVAAMDVVPADDENTRLLIATRKGFGKLSQLRHYRQQKRGGKGLITLKLTSKNGKISAAQVIAEEDKLYLVTEQAQLIHIPLEEVRQTGRNTQGVRLARMDSSDSVSAIRAVGARRTPADELDMPLTEAVNGEDDASDELVDEAGGEESSADDTVEEDRTEE